MLIRVKVFVNSRRRGIIEKSDGCFEVRVKERPAGNKANQAVLAILSKRFRIPQQNIRLLRGAKQRNKIFKIGGDF